MKASLVCLVCFSLLGCATRNTPAARTLGWIRVETENLIIRTDVDRSEAVALAKKYQRLHTAIAENELPCAFDRLNAPVEFVMLRREQDIERLNRPYTDGVTIGPPSEYLDARTQFVMFHRAAARDTQLFVHELTHAAVALCFPGARPWLHEGMASFYETARLEGDELVLGMPAYGFVQMSNVEPMFDIYRVNVHGTDIWMLPTRLLPDFDELRRLDADDFYFLGRRRSVSEHRQTTAHYAGAWNAVHLLQLGDRTLEGRFEAYLTSLARGNGDDQAWRRVFSGVDVASRYRAYVDEKYKMGRRRVDLPPSPEPSVQSMSPVEAALLWARLYGWTRDEDADRALDFLDFAATTEPASTDVMLHLAAFQLDRGDEQDADRALALALETSPDDPDALATAILWYSGPDAREERRAELDAWAQRLGRVAQTAFHFAQLGEYWLWVVGDAQQALRELNRSLALDATSWRVYAVAGRALDDLGRTEAAIRAYFTAVALTGHARAPVRAQLRNEIARLQRVSGERGRD